MLTSVIAHAQRYMRGPLAKFFTGSEKYKIKKRIMKKHINLDQQQLKQSTIVT